MARGDRVSRIGMYDLQRLFPTWKEKEYSTPFFTALLLLRHSIINYCCGSSGGPYFCLFGVESGEVIRQAANER